MFAARAVANAVAGQQFVFVVDDVDLLCSDERATAELSDLFARVVSRSAGRARFLFVCASERMNVLGALEKRTGSLFPPSTRYELGRLPPPRRARSSTACSSYSGVAADPALADAVVQGIGRGRPVLPADLQLAGLAMRDLADLERGRAGQARRRDRARVGVAARRVQGDRQRALGAAAVRRARLRRAGAAPGRAGRPADRP